MDPMDPMTGPRDGRRAARLASRRVVASLLALGAAAALSAGCASFDEQQRRWIFQPGANVWRAGAQAAQGMQDVWIDYTPKDDGGGVATRLASLAGVGDSSDSSDSDAGNAQPEAAAPVRLHGLWLAHSRDDAPILLYLHGARFDVRSSAQRMRRMHELGFAVLAVDYRGFGQSSEALPSEHSAAEDAQAAWDWLAARYPTRQRYLFGHSLGGAIAMRIAPQARELRGLIVEGSFPSMHGVIASMKWGWLPFGPLLTQRFDAGLRIDELKAPVLVVHGSDDALVKPQLGRALFERATAPKRFVLVEGGNHHNTNSIGQPQYRAAIAELFGIGT